MGKHRRRFGFFLTAFLLIAAALPVRAAGTVDSYTYTVTFFPGDKGLFNLDKIIVSAERDGAPVGSVEKTAEKITVSGLQYGDRVTITPDMLVAEAKYYVTGVRRAGYDNKSEEASLASNPVIHDAEYVISYGVPGDMVEYTVRYVDADGNSLLSGEDHRTYRGKIGDTPVAGYIYFPGYRPRAYNLTKTLTDKPEENVFVFVYDRLPSGAAGGGTTVETTTETITTYLPDGTAGVGDAAAGVGDAAAGAGGAAAPAGAAEAPQDAGADAEQVELEDEPVPEELVNLDDEETPLAGRDMSDGLQPSGYIALFAGLAGAAILAAGFLFFYLKKCKKEKAGENDADES